MNHSTYKRISEPLCTTPSIKKISFLRENKQKLTFDIPIIILNLYEYSNSGTMVMSDLSEVRTTTSLTLKDVPPSVLNDSYYLSNDSSHQIPISRLITTSLSLEQIEYVNKQFVATPPTFGGFIIARVSMDLRARRGLSLDSFLNTLEIITKDTVEESIEDIKGYFILFLKRLKENSSREFYEEIVEHYDFKRFEIDRIIGGNENSNINNSATDISYNLIPPPTVDTESSEESKNDDSDEDSIAEDLKFVTEPVHKPIDENQEQESIAEGSDYSIVEDLKLATGPMHKPIDENLEQESIAEGSDDSIVEDLKLVTEPMHKPIDEDSEQESIAKISGYDSIAEDLKFVTCPTESHKLHVMEPPAKKLKLGNEVHQESSETSIQDSEASIQDSEALIDLPQSTLLLNIQTITIPELLKIPKSQLVNKLLIIEAFHWTWFPRIPLSLNDDQSFLVLQALEITIKDSNDNALILDLTDPGRLFNFFQIPDLNPSIVNQVIGKINKFLEIPTKSKQFKVKYYNGKWILLSTIEEILNQ
ncbi:unnamed protein product [Candida verbasci]|uniref:Uncharacterized protein n=1 Tax=Candida verbasci TaxID=1227364 RepID=A0A9W4TVV9_9ASCO|nr:unnamed protein product [Candida verbasci]